jgi:hypothetical protein
VDAERVARNDATFRRANERLEESAQAYGVERVPFLCECADVRCTEVLQLTIAEYEHVRENGRHFLSVPGHEAAAKDFARVVEQHDGWVVVEKIGEAAKLAEQLDPRERNRLAG